VYHAAERPQVHTGVAGVDQAVAHLNAYTPMPTFHGAFNWPSRLHSSGLREGAARWRTRPRKNVNARTKAGDTLLTTMTALCGSAVKRPFRFVGRFTALWIWHEEIIHLVWLEAEYLYVRPVFKSVIAHKIVWLVGIGWKICVIKTVSFFYLMPLSHKPRET
jgi:hypothetical protein